MTKLIKYFFLIFVCLIEAKPFESTYEPLPSENILIKNANIYDGEGNEFQATDLLIQNRKIVAIGKDLPAGSEFLIIDASGKWVTPGIIDIHSHMGVYPAPGVSTSSDGNEATSPVTADVWAEHSIWVQDPQYALALKGGVTAFHILPGSANLIGGRGVTVKNLQRNTINSMKFPDAPHSLKMACGENPKRVHNDEERGPSTRMGNLAHMREIFRQAQDYQKARKSDIPPTSDLNLETLIDVLEGEIRVHIHCYRQDDIEGIYRVMDEFGIQVASFQHALEAYKVRDIIIEHGTAIATWPDWWGFKMEAYDATPYNASIVKREGGVVAIHSDSAKTIQRLYTEAAKVIRYGATEQEVLEMITLDPAKMLGIEKRVGSIEVGKDADLALFSKHPLDVYTRVDMTWIDGEIVYQKEVSHER